MFWQKLREISKERGQVLVLSAFAMTAFLGLVAMVVDGGIYLYERRHLQNAADAAALAGVPFLPGDTGAAEAAARAWAANNGMDPSEITSVAFEDGNARIRVELQRDVPALFARALGFIDFNANASAAAQTGSSSGITGLAPFGVLESAVNYCDTPPPVDCLVTLKYDVNNTGATIGDLDFDNRGGGGAELSNLIRGGNKLPVCSINEPSPPPGCQSMEPQKTGNTTGKIRTAVNWRISETTAECDTLDQVIGPDLDHDGTPDIVSSCNPWNQSAADTDGDGGTCDNLPNGAGSCRLIAIPVIAGDDDGNFPPPDQEVTNIWFALFWLEPFANSGTCSGNSCEVRGYFIDAEASVSGLLGAPNPGNNPFVVSKLVE
jgi:hypothetical protein